MCDYLHFTPPSWLSLPGLVLQMWKINSVLIFTNKGLGIFFSCARNSNSVSKSKLRWDFFFFFYGGRNRWWTGQPEGRPAPYTKFFWVMLGWNEFGPQVTVNVRVLIILIFHSFNRSVSVCIERVGFHCRSAFSPLSNLWCRESLWYE